MNVAALMSGFMVDAFVIGIPDHVAIGDTSWTGIRFLIMSCTVGNVASVLITFFCTRDIKMLEDDEVDRVSSGVQSSASPLHTDTVTASANTTAEGVEGAMSTFEPKRADFLVVLRELLASPTFQRFTVLILILVNLRSIFRYTTIVSFL